MATAKDDNGPLYDVSQPAVPFPMTGRPARRYEAIAKVTGKAIYAADEAMPATLHAYLVTVPQAKGTITAIDDADARKVRSVRLVLTHENMPALTDVTPYSKGGQAVNSLPPLGDATVRHSGQMVAMVVAESIEAARRGAELVRVSVDGEPAVGSIHTGDARERREVPKEIYEPIDKGDTTAALERATAKIDVTYRTPTQHHNPIELFSASASWSNGILTAAIPSQWVAGMRSGLATAFRLPTEKVRVVSQVVGGGFGSKAMLANYAFAVAAAARMLDTPVKLYVSRHQAYGTQSFRPQTTHRIRMGIENGKLSVIDHEQDGQTSTFDVMVLPGTEQTTRMYDWSDIRAREFTVATDTNTPGFMRAPAEVPAIFALESAVDELAVAAGLDPVELRIASSAKGGEPVEGKPWTSHGLDECLRRGAERFRWQERPGEAKAQRDSDWLFGQGVATAMYPTYTQPATAEVRFGSDLSVRVSAAGHELGGGTYTVLQQIAAGELGVPLDKVRVELGSSDMPVNGVAGGSMQTASLGSAVLNACRNARVELAKAATASGGPLEGADAASVRIEDRKLVAGDRTVDLEKAFDQVPFGIIEVRGSWVPGEDGLKSIREFYRSGAGKMVGFVTDHYARAAFGAQFVEVAVNARTGEVRVPRMVGAFACGRIMNERTARSQLMGGMIWGVGSVLHEATEVDHRHARYINSDLGEYFVPVNADVPSVEVIMVEEEDRHVNPLGVKGIGEIGITGVNAAVANAVHHATGIRLREVPIRMDHLLGV